ncbi:MAG: SPOR domain-containing protein [Pseudomonadota bacterium]
MATRGDDAVYEDRRDEDRLPWLETAEDDWREGPSWQKIAAFVAIGLALIAAAIYGIYWYKNRGGPAGTGELIAAQDGDYKVKPDEPGGMKVDGEGDAALATSQGKADAGAAINLNAAPEAPVAGQKASPGKAPVVAGGAVAVPGSGGKLTAARPGAAPTAAAASASRGALVQLGSFPSEAAANGEWASKSKRFGYLSALGKSVERAEVNGNTVYRLRVNAGSAGAATTLCGKLKVAGEACFVPN